ncbi:MAG: two-component regulator propeller domain-containing protein, partial [Anaerolineae bacterium]
MKQRHIALALAMAIVVAAPRGAEAQQGRGGWQTMASGDEVLAVATDPFDAAVLWVGTEAGGLVRWDLGNGSFDQYAFPQQSGLDGNQVRDIALDAAGVPWLATDRGVTYAGTEWRTYRQADGLPSDDITAVAVGGDGTVWAGTRADGMAELPPGDGVWQVHDLDEDANGPGVNRTADVAEGPDSRIWVAHGRASSGSQPALSVYDPATGAWSHVEAGTPGGDDGAAPPTDQIMALAFDAEGELWAGSWAHGVLAYDGMTWGQFEESAGVCDDKVWAIAASGGEVWAACGDDNAGYGVSRYDGSSWTTWTTDEGLPTDVVTSIAVSDGVAFLGTNGPGNLGSGVVPLSTFVDDALTTAPTTPYANDITAIAFDGQGRTWVGTRGAGLMMRSGGAWQQFTRASTGGGLVGDLVTDLAWSDGRLWVATSRNSYESGAWVDGGVSAYDPAGDSWFSLTTSNSALPSNEVSTVAVDDDGFVWLGIGIAQGEPGDETGSLQAGLGVAEYDPATDQFMAYYDYDGTSGTLTGNTVADLAAADGAVWAATSYHFDTSQRRRGGGVSRYADGAWSPWVAGDAGLTTFHGSGIESDPDPFITGDVRSVAVGASGSVWAGTWDLESGSLSRIWPYVDAVINRYDDGVWAADRFLGSGWVSAVVEDGGGLPWLG